MDTNRKPELIKKKSEIGKQREIEMNELKEVPFEPTHEQWCGVARHLGRYMQMHDRYCPKTLKKYFDRFIGEPPEWLSKEVGDWGSERAFATADLPVFIYKAMIHDYRGG